MWPVIITLAALALPAIVIVAANLKDRRKKQIDKRNRRRSRERIVQDDSMT